MSFLSWMLLYSFARMLFILSSDPREQCECSLASLYLSLECELLLQCRTRSDLSGRSTVSLAAFPYEHL